MRIDQPEPGDPSAPPAPDAPRAPGAERRPAAERPGATEAAAERRPGRDTEAVPDRPARRESEAVPDRPARRESEAVPDRPAQHETEAVPERPPRHETEAVPERSARRETGPAAEAAGRPEAREPVSRADQIAAHLRYRETVSVTLQAAADRAAWAQARPELRAAWEDHKERYPERTRAVPHTTPDGSWSAGEHRRLDPEQNTEATKAHADLADEADRHILPALRRIEAADPDRQLAGLEHMVKGEDRLKEKLADAWSGRPGLNVMQVLNMIPDAVRSTLTYSSERYADGVITDIGRLKAEGFELLKLKNLWHADQYKGVNSQWRRPDTGTRFEMQFHTPESLDAKELTHEAYERIRSNAALPVDKQDLDEERDLENFQRHVNAQVATPPGTDRIKDFPEKPNG